MESIFTYICEHAQYAHLIIFGLIMLAGLSVPISEDVMLLIAGGIASTCIPENAIYMYVWIYFACWFSAWEAYWMGRLLGPKLFSIGWFNHLLSPKRLKRFKYYYESFGIFTFIIGRFIPGGVRNAIFLSSGLTKMPFLVFILRDSVACLIASLTVFYIGFISGQNIHAILNYAVIYERVIIGVIVGVILTTIAIFFFRKRRKLYKGEHGDAES